MLTLDCFYVVLAQVSFKTFDAYKMKMFPKFQNPMIGHGAL